MHSQKVNIDILRTLKSNTLSTRDAANFLFRMALKKKRSRISIFNYALFSFPKNPYEKGRVEFNFKNITNISRAFADEFIKKTSDLKSSSNIYVFVKNASSDILRMLEIAKASQIKKKNVSKEEFDHLTFSDVESLEEFLAPL